MDWTVFGSLAGGVGLFLLGMRLMTDGLRLAAGRTLRSALSRWTRTPLRGLWSGFLVTAAVQSSSAVTVAVIGFVNAGLLSLYQTVWVIYGTNVGTTVTGWLVALAGFEVDVKALALPFIGLGMLVHVTGARSQRRASFGEALAGFGIFFLGIAVLRSGFEGVGEAFRLDMLDFAGGWCLPVLGLGGFVLTCLMQSSSAAIAVVLTAAAQGVVGVECAAAAVIGANVGTTSTAVLAVIDATPNARRIAAAHVLFNLVTAGAALVLLPWVMPGIVAVRSAVGYGFEPAGALALFHTVFNLAGVVLMWPLTMRTTRFLSTRFRTEEEDLGKPRHLDRTVANTPSLAVDALGMELERVAALARDAAMLFLNRDRPPVPDIRIRRDAVARLELAIGDFVAHIQRYNLGPSVSSALPLALRVAQYYFNVADLSYNCAKMVREQEPIVDPDLKQQAKRFHSEAMEVLLTAVPCREGYDAGLTDEKYAVAKREYKALKEALLEAGADKRLGIEAMTGWLEVYSYMRRVLKQAVKGGWRLAEMPGYSRICPPEEESLLG